jgi:hypothetical protein
MPCFGIYVQITEMEHILLYHGNMQPVCWSLQSYAHRKCAFIYSTVAIVAPSAGPSSWVMLQAKLNYHQPITTYPIIRKLLQLGQRHRHRLTGDCIKGGRWEKKKGGRAPKKRGRKMSKDASMAPLLTPYKMGTFDLSHRSAFSFLPLSLSLCKTEIALGWMVASCSLFYL